MPRASPFYPWCLKGDVAIEVMRRLAAALARQTERREEEVLSHTWGRLGVILQRVNGQIQPTDTPPTIDGVQ